MCLELFIRDISDNVFGVLLIQNEKRKFKTFLTPFLLVLSIAMVGAPIALAQFISGIERRNSTNTAPSIAPHPLTENELTFVDRTYNYVEVPIAITGAQYVMVANNDKTLANYELDVTLAKEATLLLFIDNRVGNSGLADHPPDWAGINPNLTTEMAWVTALGFMDMGIDIGIDENDGHVTYWSSVFYKQVSSGTITLYELNPAAGGRNMYGVAAFDDPPVWPLVFTADFEDQSLHDWEPTDASAWRIEDAHGGKVLSLFKDSSYSPPYRSPYNINLVRDVVVDTFTLDLEMLSTNSDYGHRDLCLFFGYQDSAHFYYVHLGKTADAHANSIFLVDNADRVSIAQYRTDGTPWDDQWHSVRLMRDSQTGRIEVYFNDRTTPVMTTYNNRFRWGRIGVGSFDDIGQFDDIQLHGRFWTPGDLLPPYGVDLVDFNHFATHWLETNCDWPNNNCAGVNLTPPDSVNLLDLQLFLTNWLTGY